MNDERGGPPRRGPRDGPPPRPPVGPPPRPPVGGPRPPAGSPRQPPGQSPPRQSPPGQSPPRQPPPGRGPQRGAPAPPPGGYRPTVAGGKRPAETALLRDDEYRPPPPRATRPPERRTGPPPRPRPPRPARRGNVGGRIRTALIVLLVLLVGFAVYIDTSLDRVAALPADSTASSEGTNWLIVGTDSRSELTPEQRAELATGDGDANLTDTIMLLHTGSGPSTLVSIPRDSMVDIPGHGRNKINSAYGRGEADAEDGGPALLTATVEGATGLKIDHYIQIGFTGFVDVVDDVGGVEMCIPEAIEDPKAALDIEAGCQTLDQATALGYVRTRATASSDFGRVERQRAFISALLDKVTSPATLLNPFRMIPLATGLSNSVTVADGDHVWHLAGLGLAMRGLNDGGITTTVPVADGVVNWDRDRALLLFDALAADEPPPENALGP